MFSVMLVTLKGIIRDRVLQGIFMTALLFLFIPAVASLSMRQVTELSITLALSLVSFVLLLLTVFLGATSIWKDMERRYSFSVLGLPIRRSDYLLGKFAGTVFFLLITSLLFWIVSSLVVSYASGIYPPGRPVAWLYLFLAIFFDFLKYTLLAAIAFLFSTISTSFFLPVFGAISIYLVGSASQEAYDYVHSSMGQSLPVFVRTAADWLYYILPNFSAFDLKINAIYGVTLSGRGLAITCGYFLIYTALVLFLATVSLSRREMK